jgi:hypothetical protein
MAETKSSISLSSDPDLYFHTQAAGLISDQERHTAGMREEFAHDMLKAIRAGALHVYSHRDGTLRAFEASWTGPFCVRPADVNDWLERKTQFKFRWNANAEERITSPTFEANRDQFPPPETVAMAEVVRHTTKANRRHALQPEIEQAQDKCKDRWDPAEVWAALSKLAEKGHGQLLGATEDGLQYLKDGEGATFTRNALRKRLKRSAPQRR